MPKKDHPYVDLLDTDIRRWGAGKGVPRAKDLDRLEADLGLRLPEDYRRFQLLYGATMVAADDDIWPDASEGEVGPYWTFKKGFIILGLGNGAPEHLDIRAVTREFHEEWHEALLGNLFPFFCHVDDADFHCFDEQRRIVFWDHEVPNLAEPVGLSFDEFLLQQTQELIARKDAIKAARTRYKRAWRDKAVYPEPASPPPDTPPDPKALRSRWTTTRTKQAMAILKKKGKPDRGALIDLLGVVPGTERIDCRGFQPTAVLFEHVFEGLDFSHADFSESRMGACKVRDCRFHATKFRDMIGADCTDCEFDGADLRGVNENGMKYVNCRFLDADFGGAELAECKFEKCTFTRVSFKKAELSGCRFTACTFQEIDFTDAFVGSCRFINPTQNMRWTDTDKKKEFTQVVSAKADWFEIAGAEYVSISVKQR